MAYTARERSLLTSGLAILGVVVAAPFEFFALLGVSSVYVEHSYERAGITDGGGTAGDTHAFYLALFWLTLLVTIELVVLAVVRHRRRPVNRPEDRCGAGGKASSSRHRH